MNHSNNNLFFESAQSIHNFIISNHQTFDDIPHDTQHLRFHKYYNEAVPRIDFSNYRFNDLKVIAVSEGSLNHIRVFVVDGLERLESMIIGKNCFRISYLNERNDGICRITNCPNLRQLEIGDESFADFKSFELSNLNSLQSIKFGDRYFEFADFSLKGE